MKKALLLKTKKTMSKLTVLTTLIEFLSPLYKQTSTENFCLQIIQFGF